MEAINSADVKSYQAYVRTFGMKLLSKAYLDFVTAQHVAHIPGVKGKLVLTKMVPDGAVLRGFDGIYQGYASQKMLPIEYEVHDFKSEFNIKPWELRYSYEGWRASQGFDPKEFPVQRYFFEQHTQKMAEEMEIAIWTGVRTGVTLDAAITARVNGFGFRVGQAITAGNTPVVTGVITTANIVDNLRAMYDKVDKRYKARKIKCYISINHAQSYYIKRGETLQHTIDNWTSAKFNTGNMEIVWVNGLADNKILMTIENNLSYIYDGPGDTNRWYLREEHYHIEGSVTGALGTQIDWMDNVS